MLTNIKSIAKVQLTLIRKHFPSAFNTYTAVICVPSKRSIMQWSTSVMAKEKSSRQKKKKKKKKEKGKNARNKKEKGHRKSKKLAATRGKEKCSRQNKKTRGKKETGHGKRKKLTAKEKFLPQKEMADGKKKVDRDCEQ